MPDGDGGERQLPVEGRSVDLESEHAVVRFDPEGLENIPRFCLWRLAPVSFPSQIVPP